MCVCGFSSLADAPFLLRERWRFGLNMALAWPSGLSVAGCLCPFGARRVKEEERAGRKMVEAGAGE